MLYNVIVIGLGAMGSAAVYQLSKHDVKVLGIDQFSPPHDFGSTHGETRITRKAIGEGAEFVPLTLRTYEIFEELEAKTNVDLLTKTGGLIIAKQNSKTELHGNQSFLKETISTAEKFNVKHQILSPSESAKRFPQFNLDIDNEVYFEDEMGFLRPENCVRLQLDLAEKQGAKIQLNEKVLEIKTLPDSVEVITDKGKYLAEKIIISAGAWIKHLVGEEWQDLFQIYRQVLYWFDVSEHYENFKIGNFPVFIWEFGRWENDYIYGFPAIEGKNGGFKVATETYFETTDPDNVNREVSQKEIDEIYEKYLENHLLCVSRKTVKTATCLYTVLPKAKFLIDYLPENKRIIVASPCSGHGFKHSAAIGEILSELIIVGKSKIDISAFSLEKFQK
jgi:sarcosine oxidase